jgi:hypothetical protein
MDLTEGRNLLNRKYWKIWMGMVPALALAAMACAGYRAEAQVSNSAKPPAIERRANRMDLVVDGKPWLVLGGELRNSSSSTLEFLQPIWPHLKSLNLNTVFTPVSWRQLEPSQGRFDFTLVDGQIQKAREHNLRLILLWFGAWKNGVSGYAPGWVLTDTRKYPRMSDTALSPFSEATWAAEARAFRELMAHLRKIDGDRHTVLMIQVENEIGVPKPARDASPAAEKAFNGLVPTSLPEYLAKHETELKPYPRELWTRSGRRKAGTWREVFGAGPETDDVFMAWSYASYVGRLAAAGKREYPLPMYVNACQLRGDTYQHGADPSGGPTDNVMDIWMASAPAIDIYAVDNYRDFKAQSARYRHRGNPLFMPETSAWWSGDSPHTAPAKAFYSFGEQHALAFSPFGIDNQVYQDHMLGLAYRKLSELAPLILEQRGTKRLHGFYRDKPEEKGETFEFDGYRATVTYRPVPAKPDLYGSFGIIVQSGADEFFVSGRGFVVRFDPVEGKAVNLGVEEGGFAEGRWRVRRHLSGDEVGGQGAETTLTPAPYSSQPVIGEEDLPILRLRIGKI